MPGLPRVLMDPVFTDVHYVDTEIKVRPCDSMVAALRYLETVQQFLLRAERRVKLRVSGDSSSTNYLFSFIYAIRSTRLFMSSTYRGSVSWSVLSTKVQNRTDWVKR